MQTIAERYGFASYNFLEAGEPHLANPFYFGTSGSAWESTYGDNGFFEVDPCVSRVRRSNTPFVWKDIEVPESKRGPRSPVRQLMDAARDFGFSEGLVIPCHFRDRIGRMHSASSVFYWKDQAHRLYFLLNDRRFELHLIMIYFIQKCVDLNQEGTRNRPVRTELALLTARERDIMSWAARGKTSEETAEILNLAAETVKSHTKNVLRKLGAANKTHAVVMCIQRGFVDM